jgi:hypothetical protein
MAARKAPSRPRIARARSSKKKTATRKRAAASPARTRRPATRRAPAGKRPAARRTKPSKRQAPARRSAARKKTATKRTAATPVARKGAATARKRTPPAVARKKATRKATPPRAAKTKTVSRTKGVAKTKAVARPARRPTSRAAAKPAPARPQTPPALVRERRQLGDLERDDVLVVSRGDDRLAASVRTGREELRELLGQHHETSPVLTAGDVDAKWTDAYAVGDEAPGGDNPTPDQDRVDDIGKALGVNYEDNEELRGSDKIIERDRHRWELDPASSDDWPHD